MTESFLVADIGGTHARFALADPGTCAVAQGRTYRTADHATLAEAARAFLDATGAQVRSAAFAVAAPVLGDKIDFTNSDWDFRPAELKAALGLEKFIAVNDFFALAAAVDRLDDADFLTLKPGAGDPSAPVLVLGPGTGFGQALIVPCADRRRIIATEGGHAGFAPQTEDEFAVMRAIARDHGRVSIERLLSGPGLANIRRALDTGAGSPGAAFAAEAIVTAARGGADPLAAKTLDLFCGALGAVAGDMALATGAAGGVVLGGGVLPKIRDLLLKSDFLERFLAKGRLRSFVEIAPVRLIVREGAALLGAAGILAEAGSGPTAPAGAGRRSASPRRPRR